MQNFKKMTFIKAPLESVFSWHERQGALERLNPPWEQIKIVEKSNGIQKDAQTIFKVKAGPLYINWHAKHTQYEKNIMFQDVQIKGPFAYWEHTHNFKANGTLSCYLEDSIKYELPLYPLSKFINQTFVKQKLEKMFRYRHQITSQDMMLIKKNKRPLKIVISGASGTVGRTLIPFLTTQGNSVKRLVRKQKNLKNDEISWNPYKNDIDKDQLNDVDAVIHLAGEQIGDARWTAKKKKIIVDSRVSGTSLIANTLAQMKSPPKTLICASAIGYYGDSGDEDLIESSNSGKEFISYVCSEWEKAAKPALDKGIRVIFLRIGIVLTPAGGALAKFYLPFNMGVGGEVGDGNQYMSWLAIDDLIGVIHHCLFNEDINGPLNVAAPNPVTNKKFVKTLAKTLKRPSSFNIPKLAIKGIFGQMGEEVLLSSIRVNSNKLLQSGYKFFYPDLEPAFRHLLGLYEN